MRLTECPKYGCTYISQEGQVIMQVLYYIYSSFSQVWQWDVQLCDVSQWKNV